ncbi:hypothetical protein [Microbulbifer agarilyticus]
MTKYKWHWLAGLLASVMAVNASAEEMPMAEVSENYYQGSWSLHGEIFNFDADVARIDGVSDSGFGLGAGYSGEYGLFNFNIGAGAILVDDKAEFSQYVENEWSGDRSTEDSSIAAWNLNVDAGVQYPLSESRKFLVGLNLGYRHLDMSRQIAGCSNCYSEDIAISGDTYLKPFVKLAFTDRVSGTLSMYRYGGDEGVDNSVQFQVNWNR